MIIHEQLKRHEGFEAKPYKCSEGKLTIGYGFNIEAGIDEDTAELLLMKQVSKIQLQLLGKYEWYRYLPDPRRDVITNMAFNLGVGGFSKFKKMIKAIEDKDNKEVVNQMLDSKWAHQVKGRAYELADQWRDNLYQNT